MRWERGHRSPNLDDRRGQGGYGGGGGGLGPTGTLLVGRALSRFGWPGILLFIAFLVCSNFIGGSGVMGPTAQQGPSIEAAGTDDAASFVGYVLDDNQQTWSQLFAQQGVAYRPAQLVLFEGQTPTGCGYGDAATGPFYCPLDENVYIDLSFYRQLSERFGAQGDFAQAYVIAHEIGHHVQHQTGVMDVRRTSGAGGTAVRTELQADCYAGIWARAAADRGLLEAGDIEEGMTAAAAIGDDRIQAGQTGRVSPEQWTHGSSAERVGWFRRGFETGSMDACDTFNGAM